MRSDHTKLAHDLPSPSRTALQNPQQRLLLAVAVVTAAASVWIFRNQFSISVLANQESALREFRSRHEILTYLAAFFIYVAVTGLSLPGATPMTLLIGWLLGWMPGILLVSFASTAGATMAFLLSRFLLYEMVAKKFGDRLPGIRQSLEREGAFYLFTLRLIPAVPFFVINLAMGLTPMRVRTFWWVSQLGMLPGTVVYVYAGSVVPNLGLLAEHGIQAVLTPAQTLRLLSAFALIGLLPLIIRVILKRFRRTQYLENS